MDPSTSEDFAATLARFASMVSPVTLPASAIAAAKANVFDGDTHAAAVLRAGVSVVPAALAAAELAGGACGAGCISGGAAGLETICRRGVASRSSIVDSGFVRGPTA